MISVSANKRLLILLFVCLFVVVVVVVVVVAFFDDTIVEASILKHVNTFLYNARLAFDLYPECKLFILVFL